MQINRVLTAVLGATTILLVAVIPAHATAWPTDGKFIVGDAAMWQIDDFGAAYGAEKDGYYLAEVPASSGYTPSIYYPMEFRFWDSHQSGPDKNVYIGCGYTSPLPNHPVDQSEVTAEPNGDITIECPRYEFLTWPGIYQQLVFRLYGTENNGWLMRQEVIVTNETSAPHTVEAVHAIQYAKNYTYDTASNSTFISSLGDTDELTANDTWFTSAVNGGASVVQTVAWAKTGSASSYTVASEGAAINDSELRNQYGDQTLAPGESRHFLQFTNMNLPPSPYTDSTAALAAAQAQTAEFASFSGRLVAGLDPTIDYIGWGMPQQTPPAPAVDPQLASTGSELSPAGIGGLAVGGLLAGVALLRRQRRLNG